MIAYVFLGVFGLAVGLVAVAVRYGEGPVDAARRADDASVLPDHVQEFVDATPTAWRASA
ncbi:hypothetical protein [Streptomyces sp. NPDC002520]